jgi:ubiquinone/menaquinone biosynthesis C-methylase UbiE
MSVKFGLPLEYKKLSEFFDAHNLSEDSDESKNSVVEKLLKRHKACKIGDLTCGTGSQVFFLAKHGYDVTGSDFSPKLLEIARNKAKNGNFNIKFTEGDVRTIKLGNFDACITMFNAIGHLTKSGFEKAIKNVSKNLKQGGIYIFDIFNLAAMNEETIKNLSMQTAKTLGETKVFQTQVSTLNNSILTSYDNYTVQVKAEKPQIFQNKFSLQIYTAKELKEMLERNGFKLLNQYGINGDKFNEQKSLNILTLAQKA